MVVYSKDQLLMTVPAAPADSKKRLSDSVVNGILTGISSNRFILLDATFLGPIHQGATFVPDPAVDLRTTNASRRRALVLGPEKQAFMSSLNESLRGGTDYPVLTGVLSLVAGVASAGAGALFTVATSALSAGKTPQAVLAREGDEIWQLERICRDGGNLVHIEHFVLVDPYRAKDQAAASEWVIHEERREVSL